MIAHGGVHLFHNGAMRGKSGLVGVFHHISSSRDPKTNVEFPNQQFLKHIGKHNLFMSLMSGASF